MTKRTFETKEQWLEYRKGKIGGTAMVSLLGKNKWRSPLKLWNEMTGRISDVVEDNDSMKQGRHFEVGIISYAVDDLGATRIDDPNEIWLAEYTDKIFSTPDALIELNSELMTVEAKKTKMALTEPTEAYIIQSNHHCGVMGLKKHMVVVYSSSLDQIFYRIYDFDAELFDYGLHAANAFLEDVANDNPPPPMTDDDFTDFTKSNGMVMEGSDTVMNALVKLKELKDQEKQLKDTKSAIELSIKELMGENEALEIGGLKYITFKSGVRKTFDGKKFKADNPDMYDNYVKETSSRSFRVNWKLF